MSEDGAERSLCGGRRWRNPFRIGGDWKCVRGGCAGVVPTLGFRDGSPLGFGEGLERELVRLELELMVDGLRMNIFQGVASLPFGSLLTAHDLFSFRLSTTD
jgi:hypothetical protein